MKRIVISAALVLAAVPATGRAQDQRLWEFRPVVGVALPTGAHRDLFKDAVFTGGQSAIRLSSKLDLLASIAWQAADTKYRVPTTTADVWVFDIGLEQSLRDETPGHGALSPFWGGGVGGRAYDFHSRELVSRTCYAAYGSAGLAYRWRVSSIRLEARDNVFCYESPIATVDAQTRNEVGLSLGFGVRF